MKAFASCGIRRYLLLHQRPFIPVLRQLGFSGSDEQVLEKVARQVLHRLSSASSASPMWIANAAPLRHLPIRWMAKCISPLPT